MLVHQFVNSFFAYSAIGSEGLMNVPQGEMAGLVPIWVILLMIATAVALLARQFRFPYVMGLLLAGLAIANSLPAQISLDSSLILNLFLPILLFEAAINTDISRLRSTIKPISLLAGPGVIVAAGITAVGLKFAINLDWITALILGTLFSITDTTSVIAVFKEVPVPARLSTIVEGESLFNNGVALVLFNLILLFHTTGTFSPLVATQQFLVVVAGGIFVGLLLGYLGSGLLTRLDDHLSSILLTLVLALGAYQVGHFMGVSGVIAVVVAGLMVGNVGLSRQVSASSQVTLYSFWDYAGFSVNTFIFLLIGVELNPASLWNLLPAVLLAMLAYHIGRILAVYPLLAILRGFDRPIPIRWQHVLFLGNIKGSLPMVLALSLPISLVSRSYIVAVVFGAILLSLISQGLSLPWLVKRLNLAGLSPARRQTESLRAQLITCKAAQDELDSMLKTGVLPEAIYEDMRSTYQMQIAKAEKALRDVYDRWMIETSAGQTDPSRLNALRRQLLLAEKGSLSNALRKRVLSETVVKERLKQIDEKLLRLEED